MIYILHGEDSTSSYNRIGEILKKYPDHKKVYISVATADNLPQILQAQNFLEEKEIIICENVLSKKREIIKRAPKLASEKPVIFWENKKLPFRLESNPDDLSIEEFKLPSTLYYFLDSLIPNSVRFANYLNNLAKREPNLNWHITNRVLLLLLAKKDCSRQTSAKIIQKPLQDWQWSKIVTQAEKFSEISLLKLFNALLRLDYLKKTGQTNTDSASVTTLLLLKHLRP